MTGTVVDLFAGSGGMSLGLELAGFTPVFVSELNSSAMATYLTNRPNSVVQDPKHRLGDILSVTQAPGELSALASFLRERHGEIDLVVGGPPCQGFSEIGHRRAFELDKVDIPSNHLYREMATFIQAVAPKAFVFENVRGLLSSRWTKGGSIGEIWHEVEKTMSNITTRVNGHEYHYEFRAKLLHASDFGVPQNRPRVIGIGLRSDIADQARVPEWHPARCATPANPRDVLQDLADPNWHRGPNQTYPFPAATEEQHWFRKNPDTGRIYPPGSPVSEQVYSKHSEKVIERFFMIRTTGHIPADLQTKKFFQRVIPAEWDDRGPTITIASLPDDFVHYGLDRSLTVREWARMQTFPDWYQFEGPRTTGGRRRAGDPSTGNWQRVVPKYTQIGNAVPVWMSRSLGLRLFELLGLAGKS